MPGLLFLLVSLAIAMVSPAWAAQTVPATEIQSAAHERIISLAPASLGRLEATQIGRVDDATVPDGAYAVKAGEITGRWPRARIGVPVQVSVAGKKVRSMTVWYAISLLQEGLVYAADYEKGRGGSDISIRTGSIDLARIRSAPIAGINDVSSMRLSRFVHAGEAAEDGDFEPLPDVASRQLVQVEVLRGAVRLLTQGEALGDGRIGEVIEVALREPGQTVRSRIISRQVVRVEN